MRRLLALATLATAAALLPAPPASACDVSQSPLCMVSPCTTVDRTYDLLNSVLVDPVPRVVC